MMEQALRYCAFLLVRPGVATGAVRCIVSPQHARVAAVDLAAPLPQSADAIGSRQGATHVSIACQS